MEVALVSVNNNGGVYPLGILSVASYVQKRVPFCNMKILDGSFDNLENELLSNEFDLIGFSSMTVDYSKTVRLAQKIRDKSKASFIIGGVHISTLPESLKDCFDFGVIGEGERTFLDIVNLYYRYGKLDISNISNIRGIVYRDKISGGLKFTLGRDLIQSLDDISIPDYSLINPKYLSYKPLPVWGDYGKEAFLLTSRGCPYKCVFCSTSLFWGKLRFFSVERVVNEIEFLRNIYRIDHIQFMDDLFIADKKRMVLIKDLLIKKGLTQEISFSCNVRANLINDALCQVMKDMNIEIVSVGLESGNNKILKFLKRDSVNVEQNKKMLSLCAKYKFKVYGSLMLGSPGETLKDMEDTIKLIDYAKKAKATRIWIFVTTPFPGSKMWEIAKQRGKVNNDMDFDLLNLQNVSNPLLLDPNINIKDFRKIFKKARIHLNYFKYKKVFLMFSKHPFRTICFLISSTRQVFTRMIPWVE